MKQADGITFGGDYLPNHPLPRSLFPPGTPLVANLECAITARPARREKAYPIVMTEEAFSHLADSGFTAVSIASNHALDAGERTFDAMIERLRAPGMPRFYGVRDQPFAELAAGGLTCAVVGCLERCRSRGRRIFPEEQVDALIRDIRPRFDRVFVTPHWGREGEYGSHPSPGQRVLAARWIESGADGILGHHPHVIQGLERIGGRSVHYSLGNLLFDHAESAGPVLAEYGMAVEWLPGSARDADSWTPVFVHQSRGLVRRIQDGRLGALAAYLEAISRDLSDPSRPWTSRRWAEVVGAVYAARERRSWRRRFHRSPLRTTPLWLAWRLMPTTRRLIRGERHPDAEIESRRRDLERRLRTP